MDFGKRDEDEQQAFLAGSHEDVEDEGSFSTKVWRESRKYLRLGLEIIMAFAIAGLLLRPFIVDSQTGIKASPVPDSKEVPKKIYTFLENTTYLNKEMFANREDTLHTLHNWIPLSSDGRGYVQIKDPDSFDLSEPYTTQNLHTSELEPVYMMTIFHQLHCLSYLVKHYQAAFNGTELTEEVAHHSAHCFDYLRQGLMCNADTSLEGKTEAGPGWGSKHECKDYDAVLKWANDKTVVKWKKIMPDEATL